VSTVQRLRCLELSDAPIDRRDQHHGRKHRDDDFRGAMEETPDGLSIAHAERLGTLMTLKFQQFEEVSLLAA
jgi:hypothetical protein